MKLTIDTGAKTLTIADEEGERTLPLDSKESFEAISRQWVRVGWGQRYSYDFTWLGVPVVQLPEDLVRVQEVIARVRPDVIIETGVAHGGSLIFYASLCKAMGSGRVVGIDIDIRAHARRSVEGHDLASYITLVQGDSAGAETVGQVRSLVREGETVLVILDSCHTKAHVERELEAYYALVTQGSYIVATDGIMHDLSDMPGGQPDWTWDNPRDAARDFAAAHPEFVLEQPAWPFSESDLTDNITYWPDAWLRRL